MVGVVGGDFPESALKFMQEANIDLWTLTIGSLIGRASRFFLVGGLLYYFGPQFNPKNSLGNCILYRMFYPVERGSIKRF
ncbi:MAG: hypothetical protein QME25_02985 [Bacteroidota bacterium]|nr:hypothetical protein [Bacteroidota bacterium]